MTEVEKIYEEEKNTGLISFDASDAWKLGNKLVKWAMENNKVLVIRISVNKHVLFQYACCGTSVENDNWVLRKENLVYYTGHSSYATALYLAVKKQTVLERYGLSTDKYAAAGGAIPIYLKDTGVIGVVTVSGMSQPEDHALVMMMLKNYQAEK